VDSKGSGDFISLREALVAGTHDTPSTIIVLNGSYTLRRGWPDVKVQSFQIVGGGNVDVTGDIKSKRCALLNATGADTSIFLENLKISFISNFSEPRHCVAVLGGASARVTRCEMRSTAAACYSDGKGSSLLLLSCRTTGPGAGPLVINSGFLVASDFHFS